jgi:hypothetical protein
MKKPDWIETPGLQLLMEHLVPEASKVLMSEDDYQPVLVTGDTGVGKSYVKDRILTAANISEGDSITVNCAAFPRELIESELFGHEPYSFTGAGGKRKLGLVESHKGVLVLDEIGTLSKYMQAKLLTFLETGDFRRIGGLETNRSETRIVALNNQDTSDPKFRQDFLYRFYIINVPALYARRQDVLYLLRRWAPDVKWTKWDLLQIMTYHWPGNLRELWLFARLTQRTYADEHRFRTIHPGVLYWLRNIRFAPYNQQGYAFVEESTKLLSRNFGTLPSFLFSQDCKATVAKYCSNLAFGNEHGEKGFLLQDLDIKRPRVNQKSSENEQDEISSLVEPEDCVQEELSSCQDAQLEDYDWEWGLWCELFGQNPFCEKDILSLIASGKRGENLPDVSFYGPDVTTGSFYDEFIRLQKRLDEKLYVEKRSPDGGETAVKNVTERPSIEQNVPDDLERAFQVLAERVDAWTYKERWLNYWRAKSVSTAEIARKFNLNRKTLSSALNKK